MFTLVWILWYYSYASKHKRGEQVSEQIICWRLSYFDYHLKWIVFISGKWNALNNTCFIRITHDWREFLEIVSLKIPSMVEDYSWFHEKPPQFDYVITQEVFLRVLSKLDWDSKKNKTFRLCVGAKSELMKENKIIIGTSVLVQCSAVATFPFGKCPNRYSCLLDTIRAHLKQTYK